MNCCDGGAHILQEVLVLSRKKHIKKLSVIRESVDLGKAAKAHISISLFTPLRSLKSSGVYKLVLATKHDSSTPLVMKLVNHISLKDDRFRKQLAAEQNMLKRITEANLPFLPRLYWSFVDNERHCLVTRYHPYSLMSSLNRQDPGFAADVMFYAAELVSDMVHLFMFVVLISIRICRSRQCVVLDRWESFTAAYVLKMCCSPKPVMSS